MKTQGTKNKFIKLRAKGYSYDKIAKQLKVSKQTLLNWGKEFERNIKGLKEIELEALLEEFHLLKEHRIKAFGKQLLAIDKELDKRQLADISTDKLMLLMMKIYEAFPETIKQKRKLMREEEVLEQTRDVAEKLARIITGEYEKENQK